jgi:hypothetical protein
MHFLHLNPKNSDKLIDKINKIIANKNNKLFILFYMEGCGPCNATRPEWNKIQNIMSSSSLSNVYIIDIDQVLSNKLKNIQEPNSFPTIRYIANGGKESENYEDSSLEIKDRTIDSFIKWIDIKLKKQHNLTGGINRNRNRNGTRNRKCKNKKCSRKYRSRKIIQK